MFWFMFWPMFAFIERPMLPPILLFMLAFMLPPILLDMLFMPLLV